MENSSAMSIFLEHLRKYIIIMPIPLSLQSHDSPFAVILLHVAGDCPRPNTKGKSHEQTHHTDQGGSRQQPSRIGSRRVRYLQQRRRLLQAGLRKNLLRQARLQEEDERRQHVHDARRRDGRTLRRQRIKRRFARRLGFDLHPLIDNTAKGGLPCHWYAGSARASSPWSSSP